MSDKENKSLAPTKGNHSRTASPERQAAQQAGQNTNQNELAISGQGQEQKAQYISQFTGYAFDFSTFADLKKSSQEGEGNGDNYIPRTFLGRSIYVEPFTKAQMAEIRKLNQNLSDARVALTDPKRPASSPPGTSTIVDESPDSPGSGDQPFVTREEPGYASEFLESSYSSPPRRESPLMKESHALPITAVNQSSVGEQLAEHNAPALDEASPEDSQKVDADFTSDERLASFSQLLRSLSNFDMNSAKQQYVQDKVEEQQVDDEASPNTALRTGPASVVIAEFQLDQDGMSEVKRGKQRLVEAETLPPVDRAPQHHSIFVHPGYESYPDTKGSDDDEWEVIAVKEDDKLYADGKVYRTGTSISDQSRPESPPSDNRHSRMGSDQAPSLFTLDSRPATPINYIRDQESVAEMFDVSVNDGVHGHGAIMLDESNIKDIGEEQLEMRAEANNTSPRDAEMLDRLTNNGVHEEEVEMFEKTEYNNIHEAEMLVESNNNFCHHSEAGIVIQPMIAVDREENVEEVDEGMDDASHEAKVEDDPMNISTQMDEAEPAVASHRLDEWPQQEIGQGHTSAVIDAGQKFDEHEVDCEQLLHSPPPSPYKDPVANSSRSSSCARLNRSEGDVSSIAAVNGIIYESLSPDDASNSVDGRTPTRSERSERATRRVHFDAQTDLTIPEGMLSDAVNSDSTQEGHIESTPSEDDELQKAIETSIFFLNGLGTWGGYTPRENQSIGRRSFSDIAPISEEHLLEVKREDVKKLSTTLEHVAEEIRREKKAHGRYKAGYKRYKDLWLKTERGPNIIKDGSEKGLQTTGSGHESVSPKATTIGENSEAHSPLQTQNAIAHTTPNSDVSAADLSNEATLPLQSKIDELQEMLAVNEKLNRDLIKKDVQHQVEKRALFDRIDALRCTIQDGDLARTKLQKDFPRIEEIQDHNKELSYIIQAQTAEVEKHQVEKAELVETKRQWKMALEVNQVLRAQIVDMETADVPRESCQSYMQRRSHVEDNVDLKRQILVAERHEQAAVEDLTHLQVQYDERCHERNIYLAQLRNTDADPDTNFVLPSDLDDDRILLYNIIAKLKREFIDAKKVVEAERHKSVSLADQQHGIHDENKAGRDESRSEVEAEMAELREKVLDQQKAIQDLILENHYIFSQRSLVDGKKYEQLIKTNIAILEDSKDKDHQIDALTTEIAKHERALEKQLKIINDQAIQHFQNQNMLSGIIDESTRRRERLDRALHQIRIHELRLQEYATDRKRLLDIIKSFKVRDVRSNRYSSSRSHILTGPSNTSISKAFSQASALGSDTVDFTQRDVMDVQYYVEAAAWREVMRLHEIEQNMRAAGKTIPSSTDGFDGRMEDKKRAGVSTYKRKMFT